MVKIKISYQSESEKEQILSLLKPLFCRSKPKYQDKDGHKLIYLTLHSPENRNG